MHFEREREREEKREKEIFPQSGQYG